MRKAFRDKILWNICLVTELASSQPVNESEELCFETSLSKKIASAIVFVVAVPGNSVIPLMSEGSQVTCIALHSNHQSLRTCSLEKGAETN